MYERIKVAVIDNGINELVLEKKLENSILIDTDGNCVKDKKKITQQVFQHGTICAKIIENIFEECGIVSIRILDDRGKGKTNCLEPALKWCYRNNIYIVNLSFGTTHFIDKCNLRRIINQYANQGMLIIAAGANSGYTSYPASFSNVIGVAAGDKLEVNKSFMLHQGIDFLAPCELKTDNKSGFYSVSKSNSYATPYITALAAKVMQQKNVSDICELKNKIYEIISNEKFEYINTCIPDWVTAAWCDGVGGRTMAKMYFEAYTDSYGSCEKYIDTIIFKEADKYKEYRKKGKNLIYLGKESIDFRNFRGFCWDYEKRVQQIRESKSRKEELQLPIVMCVLDKNIDLFLFLTELKAGFANKGYNAYAVSTEQECVLYDIEYAPEQIFYHAPELLFDFWYWQTYYQQSDVIVSAVYHCESVNSTKVFETADMLVFIESGNKKYNINILCEGQMKNSYRSEIIDFRILFQKILSLLLD